MENSSFPLSKNLSTEYQYPYPQNIRISRLSACVSLVSLPDAFFNFVAGWLAHQDGGGTVPCQTVSFFARGTKGTSSFGHLEKGLPIYINI